MFQHLPKLFTAPRGAWVPIRQHADAHPWSFLPVLLLLPLIPAISTYIGTAHVGWEVYGSDDTHYLRSSSAMYLALMAYLAYITGIVIMSYMIRWVLFRTPGRPTLLQSMAFTTCISVPLMIGGGCRRTSAPLDVADHRADRGAIHPGAAVQRASGVHAPKTKR